MQYIVIERMLFVYHIACQKFGFPYVTDSINITKWKLDIVSNSKHV